MNGRFLVVTFVLSGGLAIIACGSSSSSEDAPGSSGGLGDVDAAGGGSSGSIGSSGSSGSADGAGAADSAGDAREPTRAEYCAGSGPPIHVNAPVSTKVTDTCTGMVAERFFRHALCTCASLTVSNLLSTDGFDSKVGPYAPGGGGGTVGVNGAYTGDGPANIGGSLLVGGAAGIVVRNPHTIDGDMWSNGPLDATASVGVDRDAHVRGNVKATNGMTVGRDLRFPQSSSKEGTITVGGMEKRADFVVDPPCACAKNELLDIKAIVEEAKKKNDNAEVKLSSTVLTKRASGATLDLPCGRFFVDEISASNPITINLTGRTVIFVAGDLVMSSKLKVNLAPGAELDLVVGGSITTSNPLELGDTTRPSAVRVYVGGPNVTLDGLSTFTGNLYAPQSVVKAADDLIVYGSVFAGEFIATNAVTIHYDRSILTEGSDCPKPPPPTGGEGGASGVPCDETLDCPSTQVCIAGTCAPCTSDAQCSSSLICVQGACTLYLK